MDISSLTKYHLKQNGIETPDPSFFGFYLVAEIPADLTAVIVDNVIATGLTMKAALRVVQSATRCVLAQDTMAIIPKIVVT